MSCTRKGTLIRQPSGWRGRITVGSGENKRRLLFDLGTQNKSVAENKLAALVREHSSDDSPEVARDAPLNTFNTHADTYFAARVARGVAMVKHEQSMFRKHVAPLIGGMPIEQIGRADVNRVLTSAIETGLRRETISKLRGLMHRIFDEAWHNEIIQENPVERTRVPKMHEVKKERAILTDEEFFQLMACSEVGIEIKMMSLVARTLGGMRASDVVRWDWSMIDKKDFAAATIPRTKTGTPHRLTVPESVRPFLSSYWDSSGNPETGPVFPIERGPHAGEARAAGEGKFAKRLRRALFKAGVVRMPPVEAPLRKVGLRWDIPGKYDGLTMPAPNPLDPLYFETETSLPVDFHSFRRAYNTALAEAGVNVQQSMHLAGHTNASTHMRYVMKTAAMQMVPDEAIPELPSVELSRDVTIQTSDNITNSPTTVNTRAGHGTRTRDPQLGKLVLYQLS